MWQQWWRSSRARRTRWRRRAEAISIRIAGVPIMRLVLQNLTRGLVIKTIQPVVHQDDIALFR